MKSTITRLCVLAAAAALLAASAGCNVVVTVTPSLATVNAGDTTTLQATSTSPQDTSFVWSSGNEAIAKVDQSGTVTGVNEGQTTITAQGASSGAQGQAAVTVSRPPGVLSAFDITVDPAIVPASDSLPSFTSGGPPRPLAAIVDERGQQTEFVENELLLTTDDMDALNAFVTRWGGEVLASVDPTGSGMDMPQTHLVRINTDLGDPSQLKHDVLTLDPDSRGASRVSSEAGLRLISASAKEAAAGVNVGMNWVARGSSLSSGGTTEAGTGPGGFNSLGSGYSPYTSNWNYLNSGSTQDIGVTRAWQLLANTHKLSNKVKIAVLDMGFSVSGNLDIPPDLNAISNVPFTDPIGTENLLSCSGGSSCPWHGTEVVGSAMGVPDNAFGTAGPGGPVAKPIVVFTLYDFFTSISAITEAGIAGARVVNMSYGAGVPAALFFTVLPFDLATEVASHFMVLCAAAGNDNKNVDSEDCFIVCWEDTWWTPCENDGVLCVGGLRQDSKYRANFSNYGSEDVDIFGPGTVIVGPDPSAPAPSGRSASGTSFSSPFVAGVAALVWAANPSLSASGVRDILVRTAHSSPDSQVRRYVDAYAAVAEALPAAIGISSPQNGATVHGGLGISLEAYVWDAGLGDATVTWTDSVNGSIGSGRVTTYDGLSYGAHTITARARFGSGATVQDSVSITVVNDPPTVTITSPTGGSSFYQGQPVLLAATSVDINEPGGKLSDAQLSWYVDAASVPIGHGHTFTIPAGTLSVGAHTIHLVGSDGSLSDTKSVSITTNPNPVDLPPDQVNITSPIQGSYLDVLSDGGGFYVQPTLTGNAHDPEDGTLTGSALTWTWSVNGAAAVTIGTGTSAVAPKTYVGEGTYTFDITLTATDSGANSSSVTIHTSVILIFK